MAARNVVRIPGGRIEYDWSAFDAIRRSPGMEAVVSNVAQGIADRAGENFGVRTRAYKSRVVATVSATNAEGMRQEATDKALSKAVR